MSYLDCLKPYRNVDLSNHLPFYVSGERVGFIQKSFIEYLKQFTDVFIYDETCVTLSPVFDNFKSRSQTVKSVLAKLTDQGVVKPNPFGPHNPRPAFQKIDVLPVGSDPFNAPLMGVERYHACLFGILHHNISVVGYIDGHVWVAKRGAKATSPHMLDHMISGSCTTEHNIEQTIADEARDEAGLPHKLLKNIIPLTTYHLIKRDKRGDVFDEKVNLFHLKTPKDFIPQSQFNDEIEGFNLISFDDLHHEILEKENLLPFSKIVFIQFLIKHRYISEKNEEYSDLIKSFSYDPAAEIAAY